MRSTKSQRTRVALFVCALLNLCSAQNATCTVTLDAHETTYSISGLPPVVNDDTSDCEFSWTSDKVVANQGEQTDEVVKRKGINDLVTSKCFTEMVYSRSCISEGGGYTVTCTVSCGRNLSLSQALKDKEISRSRIPAVVTLVGFSILALMLVFSFLCFKFRDKTPSCGQLGCMYTAVKTQTNHPADVEAGNG